MRFVRAVTGVRKKPYRVRIDSFVQFYGYSSFIYANAFSRQLVALPILTNKVLVDPLVPYVTSIWFLETRSLWVSTPDYRGHSSVLYYGFLNLLISVFLVLRWGTH